MKKEVTITIENSDDYVGCYGSFNMQDSICRNYCALKLRCAIEREQNMRIDLLEELIDSDAVVVKMQ